MDLLLLVAAQPTVPNTPAWNWKVGLIISLSCLLVLLIASRNIKYPQVGSKLPVDLPFFNSLSLGTFIGSMAFGHVIGVATVLGLTNIGWLK